MYNYCYGEDFYEEAVSALAQIQFFKPEGFVLWFLDKINAFFCLINCKSEKKERRVREQLLRTVLQTYPVVMVCVGWVGLGWDQFCVGREVLCPSSETALSNVLKFTVLNSCKCCMISAALFCSLPS